MAQPAERQVPVSFSSFVVSLAQSAMIHLGELDDPMAQGRSKDLLMARHTIDLLGMIKDKTEGNLDEEESKLLESVLYDLRLRFVGQPKG